MLIIFSYVYLPTVCLFLRNIRLGILFIFDWAVSLMLSYMSCCIKSLQLVIAAMKLKYAYSLEGKL